ncbi:MAG: helix-turn-helix domain-containing protein [Alphaproteobacteria bacterium]|nr:helix-turn-helix domain-containing protein [Alphaproteobacteria bacterium]
MTSSGEIVSGSTIDRHLGRKIKEGRVQRSLSVDALAQQIEVPSAQIEVMESGDVRIASLQLARIAKVLDLPLSWFFAGLPGQDVFDAPRAHRSV